MKLKEAIDILNLKEMTVGEMAKQFGVSKDLFSDVLKEKGYKFNNKSKLREYIGEGEVEDIELEALIEERKSLKGQKNNKRSSNISKKNIGNKLEKDQDKVKVKDELFLTEDEIKFVKEAFQRKTMFDKDLELNWEFSQLPVKEKATSKKNPNAKEPAKITIIISQKTDAEWNEFVDKIEEKYRYGKHDLYEMALRKFMKDFS